MLSLFLWVMFWLFVGPYIIVIALLGAAVWIQFVRIFHDLFRKDRERALD